MSALRQRSISSSSRVRKAWSRSRALSTASAAWLAKVPSRLRSPASCRVLQHQNPHRPIVEHQGHGDPRRRFGVDEPERSCLPAGDERGQLGRRQGLTHGGSYVQTLATVLRTRLAVRQDQGSPPGEKASCTVLTMWVTNWFSVRSPIRVRDRS